MGTFKNFNIFHRTPNPKIARRNEDVILKRLFGSPEVKANDAAKADGTQAEQTSQGVETFENTQEDKFGEPRAKLENQLDGMNSWLK